MAKGANDKGVMNSVIQFLTGGFLTSEKVKGFLPIFAVILLLRPSSTSVVISGFSVLLPTVEEAWKALIPACGNFVRSEP